ncbi:MAG: mechanosensitive ion channel family protein [Myxococcota bacterium]|nr:mechanosensitive ion channel family protein [Myxococcota bacterium]
MRFLSAFFFVLLPLVAHGADSPSSEKTRKAALSLLAWLQPDDYDPTKAATCLDTEDSETAQRVAIELKSVLDSRGLFVKMEDLPDVPEVEPEVEGAQVTVMLHPEVPEIFLEQVGGEWKVSKTSLAAVPLLYEATFSGISQSFQQVLPTVFMKPLPGGLQPWQFMYLLSAVFIGLLFATVLDWLIRRKASGVIERLGFSVDSAVFDRLGGPIRVLGASLLVWAAVPDLHLSVRVAQAILFIAKVVTSYEVVVVGIRAIDVLTDVARQRADRTEGKMDDQLVPIVSRSAKLLVGALGVVFVFQNMGVDVGSLVAGLGVGGLAFALAAKDALANVFGSLTIFTDKPFQVGDAVQIGGIDGVIEEVGLRSTRVRTFHNSLVTIPNSAVATSRIDNLGARPARRTRTSLGVVYGTPPEVIQAFVEGVRAILAGNPATVKDNYEVNLNAFGPSSLDILVNFHLEVPDWHTEMTERACIYMEILRLAEALGVSFAFPSSSVYVESTPEKPLGIEYVTEPELLRAKVESFGPGGSQARPGGPVISSGFVAGEMEESGEGSS